MSSGTLTLLELPLHCSAGMLHCMCMHGDGKESMLVRTRVVCAMRMSARGQEPAISMQVPSQTNTHIHPPCDGTHAKHDGLYQKSGFADLATQSCRQHCMLMPPLCPS